MTGFLRLIDGALSSDKSSSVNAKPRTRANRKRGKCHLPGILPCIRQLETALCTSPSSAAKAEGPPKRSTTSFSDLRIKVNDINCSDMTQAENIDSDEKPELSQNVIMLRADNRIDQKRDMKAAIMARVENVRLELGQTPTAFAKRMGVAYKDYKGWVDRESIDLPSVVRLALSLNLSLDYLCCVIDEPHRPTRDVEAPDYWASKAAIEKGRPQQRRQTA